MVNVKRANAFVKPRTVRYFNKIKNANLLKVSVLFHEKRRTAFAFRGERGIRTPGASQHDGFQDRCNRPLYHLSLQL